MNTAVTRLSTNSIPVFREMLGVLDKYGVDAELKIPIKDSRLHDFCRGIKEKSFKTDLDALRFLYPKKTENRSSKVGYNKIKSRLRVLLIRSINSSINPPLNYSSDTELIYQKLNQEFNVYNLLYSRNLLTSASYLGELLIANSIKHGFSEFILKVASELIEYFSIFDPNPAKVKYFRSVQLEYLETIKWEQRASFAYATLMNQFVKNFSPENKELAIAENFIIEASPIIGNINSTKFHFRYFLIKVFQAYGSKSFKEMDRYAVEALEYLNTLSPSRISTENMFLKKRVEANLILSNFDLCNSLLEKILDNSKRGHTNWYNSLEIRITLFLHMREYPESIESFILGKSDTNFHNLPITTSQRWGLLEAYINFLQLTGAAPETPTMSRYRINKFINDTPQYSEDKKGRNIQLIIAQLLFYIIDKNWDKMEEKIDALQKYGTRYLRKNELFRSQVFIKMLLEIPRRMYHPQAIIRHTAKYRKRLEEMAPNIDLNGSTLEIIPYEHLWELIIQNIVPPKYTRQSKLSASD